MKCSMICENKEINAGNTCCCLCSALLICKEVGIGCAYATSGIHNAETCQTCQFKEEEKQ